ncbi:MAG TPA: NAD(P)/FAD-dependent oxidoreductase [Dehalococcoidia bacterium]|jgi:cation diffusion facilitator CzcD-associated flavoprotein CzcO|nr:NAD(P)/FAD-dependent oxidoreductase [Dehalococcoidia bacterium]|tara:strand:+ start:1030 stop:2679 length:1650 start_codon:yes stop_codon:yes gene_type:complete
MANSENHPDFDAVVIGAGFAGLGMLRKLREEHGMSVQVYETGDGVGGTWYWNRYPGARCDSESYMYCFSFSKEMLQDWNWSGKYPEQPEILSYLNHVADRFDLRRNIQFNTRVTSARFLEDANLWEVETDQGDRVTSQFLITGIGCISSGNVPDIKGLDSFQGEQYHTGSWPHEEVDFAGKRVAVIGTGSSGIQSIPVIARQAEHLTVFQRTPQYTIPARHGTIDRKFLEKTVKPNYDDLMERARWSTGGFPMDRDERSALEISAAERLEIYEASWAEGGIRFLSTSFKDVSTDRRANDTMAEFIRKKIREMVQDPETAEKLMPTDHPFGSKRPLIDTDYFETYNRENVELVDIRHSPIQEITPRGIRTDDQEFEFDMIVFATGFDAMTGTFFKMDIRGRDGLPLKEKWSEGPKTYLGLQTAGFPNMFMITGPGSPSVLSNMPVSIEQHIDWIADLLQHMREHDIKSVEAEADAEKAWVVHVNEVAEPTMFMQANSWYLGANIPGKPRVFMPYAGGVGTYRKKCNEVADNGYEGFILGAGRRGAETVKS